MQVDVERQLGIQVTQRIVRQRAQVGDGVESLEVIGRHVAKIHVERLDHIGWAHEVALVEQPGVEAGDLVTGCSQDRDHLDTDVAEVPCH